MLMIILYHLVEFTNYRLGSLFSVNDFILTLFASLGKIGVALFVFITGYYKIKSKDIKLSKLFELELQVLFYSIGFFLIFMLFGKKVSNVEELFRLLLPNISKSYWFFLAILFCICLFLLLIS